MSSVVRNEKEMLETVDGMECAMFMVAVSLEIPKCKHNKTHS